MPRIVFFIGLFSLFCIGLVPFGAKAADSAYYVKGVQVDILDQSAVKARNKAFLEAQKKAFVILAERFEPPETLSTLKPPADGVLSGMIQDFEIVSEQLSTKRYRGKFDFRFKSAAVNQYFGHGAINYSSSSDTDPHKTLLIPYYQEDKKDPVWDVTKNPFLSSLKLELPKDGSILLPTGNISDKTDLGNGDPLKLSYKTIRRLKARYDVDSVFLALTHVDLKNTQLIKIDILRTDRGRIEVARSFDVSPQKAAKATFIAIQEPLTTPSVAENTNAPQQLQPDTAYPDSRPVVENLASEQQIASQPVVSPTTQAATAPTSSGEANVKIFFTSLPEWISIQKKISQSTGVKQLRISSLKSNQVDAVISYTNWGNFSSSLAAMGFILQPQSGNSYILKRSSTAY